MKLAYRTQLVAYKIPYNKTVAVPVFLVMTIDRTAIMKVIDKAHFFRNTPNTLIPRWVYLKKRALSITFIMAVLSSVWLKTPFFFKTRQKFSYGFSNFEGDFWLFYSKLFSDSKAFN